MHDYGAAPGAGDAEASEPVDDDQPHPAFPRSNSAGDELFAYGTLQFAPVLEALLGRVPPLRLGVTKGWRVAALPDRVYPGLIPDSERIAVGIVVAGLTRAEWEILDRFEDAEYDLRPIRLVRPAAAPGTHRADPGSGAAVVAAYVWTAAVTADDWYPEVFARQRLAEYAQRCERWRERGMPADGW
ncbi:gamma-glutamylcyclotransferase family protein [Nocardia sp. alder85J]|uniref:gamma-glutamylcyclotransferase family protein n=1 Tax=Nocardia sp. alder85J TaxID=2862949 RepID=UPI001CD2FDCC|nr:gamma-glutamylcyclotransferase family protein [Nocardia sp. alder85J]MCX4094893.1 gamma-glutamylcyclotransferase [Nocardia sp. alder85J]